MLIKSIFALSVLLLFIASVLFYLHLGGASNFLVVGIDSFRGINFLGGIKEIIGILATGASIIVVNALLTWKFSKENVFLAHLLSFATLFLSLLILITIGVIITNN